MRPCPQTKGIKKEEKSGQPKGILTYTVTAMSARGAQEKHLKRLLLLHTRTHQKIPLVNTFIGLGLGAGLEIAQWLSTLGLIPQYLNGRSQLSVTWF